MNAASIRSVRDEENLARDSRGAEADKRAPRKASRRYPTWTGARRSHLYGRAHRTDGL